MPFVSPAKPAGRKSRQTAYRRTIDATDTTTLVANILDAYTEAIRHGARPWYQDAHDHAADLAERHGITLRQSVGIIAALSPSTAWERNLQLASTLIQTGDCAHAYGECITKARRIRNGEDPTDVLGGPKVRSFFRNILYPTRPGAVTIDRHAFSIAVNAPQRARTRTLSDADLKRGLSRRGAYTLTAAAYRCAARRLGILPQDLQSITWDYWRDVHAYGTTANVEAF